MKLLASGKNMSSEELETISASYQGALLGSNPSLKNTKELESRVSSFRGLVNSGNGNTIAQSLLNDVVNMQDIIGLAGMVPRDLCR